MAVLFFSARWSFTATNQTVQRGGRIPPRQNDRPSPAWNLEGNNWNSQPVISSAVVTCLIIELQGLPKWTVHRASHSVTIPAKKWQGSLTFISCLRWFDIFNTEFKSLPEQVWAPKSLFDKLNSNFAPAALPDREPEIFAYLACAFKLQWKVG